MPCALILACSAQNMTPNYPLVGHFRILLNSLSNLFNSFHHVSLFEFSPSPMQMCVVPIAVLFFGLLTNIYGLAIELVHVVQKCDVVVSIGMKWVLPDAVFELFCSSSVSLKLKINQAKVVIKLGVNLLINLAQLNLVLCIFCHYSECT